GRNTPFLAEQAACRLTGRNRGYAAAAGTTWRPRTGQSELPGTSLMCGARASRAKPTRGGVTRGRPAGSPVQVSRFHRPANPTRRLAAGCSPGLVRNVSGLYRFILGQRRTTRVAGTVLPSGRVD